MKDFEIEVTDKAIDKISGIIESDDDYSAETTLFRILVKGKTATNYEYGIGLEFKKDEYDTSEFFFDVGKFKMIIDERSMRLLDGATVDYKEDLNVQGFDIINPNKPEASDLEERVMELIDATVNPQIASHGGNIQVVGIDAGILYIEMLGGCQGCSASQYTLQHAVDQQIKSQFPEIKSIVDTTNHEAGENPYYA